MPISLTIALRYLFSRKSHSAVNIISIVSMAGVAVATAAMVCVLSVFNGFSDLAASRFSAFNPQLKVVPAKGKVLANADSLAAQIGAIAGVARAVPTLSEQALAVFGGKQMGISVLGVDRGWENTADIQSLLIDGTWMGADSDFPMATIGVGTAVTLGLRPNLDRPMAIFLPRRLGRINPANPMAAFRGDSIFVSGVLQSNQQEIDRDITIVPISVLRQLLDYDDGEASAIAVSLNPGASEKAVAKAIAQLPGGNLRVLNRFAQEEASFKMIEIEKWISFLMLAFILIIASFNIVSTLSMLIIEKDSSIFILRALGCTNRAVNTIFVLEGWLITLFGALLGLLLGVALTLAQQYGQFIQLGGDHAQMSLTAYPVRLAPLDLPEILAVVLLVGLATGLTTLAIRKSPTPAN